MWGASIERERGRLWASLASDEIVIEDAAADLDKASGIIAVTSRRLVFLATPMRQDEAIWADVPLEMLTRVEVTGPARLVRGARLDITPMSTRPLRFTTVGGGIGLAETLMSAIESAAHAARSGAAEPPDETTVDVLLTASAAEAISRRGGTVWIAFDEIGTLRASSTPQYSGRGYAEHDDEHPVRVMLSEELLWCSAVEVEPSRITRRLTAKLHPAPFLTSSRCGSNAPD